jgi:hypothetical protein
MKPYVVSLSLSVAGAVLLGMLAPSVRAHTTLRHYIHHQAVFTFGEKHIDLTVELHFHEDVSLAERRKMDADRDGHLSAAETEAYLESLAAALDEGLRLTHRGEALDLVSLYDPALDLQGDARVRASGHVLKLYYFARRPAGLDDGDALAFEEDLWPQAKALRTLEVHSTDGRRWHAAPASQPGAWRIECRGMTRTPKASDDAAVAAERR